MFVISGNSFARTISSLAVNATGTSYNKVNRDEKRETIYVTVPWSASGLMHGE